MIIENGDTLTGIDTNIRLSFEFDLAKLSLLKFELIHMHLTVDKLEHILDVSILLTDNWSYIENPRIVKQGENINDW